MAAALGDDLTAIVSHSLAWEKKLLREPWA